MKLAIAGQLSGTPHRVMFAELFSWWTGQLRELAAPLLRRASGKPRDALVITCDPGATGLWHAARRRDGTSVQLGTLSLDAEDTVWRRVFASRRRGEPVVIALGRPFLIRRTEVPIAAASALDRLLRYEMDRLTPFAADDVLFSHRVLSRDTAAGRLLVDVAVAPKAWVRDLLERLRSLSIQPDALEALADEGTPLGTSGEATRPDQTIARISLDDAEPARRARLAWRIVCAGLAIAVVAVPFIRQSLALAAVEDQIASLRPGMEQVDALRRRIAAGTAGSGQIVAARERGTAALRLLATLTDLLPDGTYLTSVSLRHEHLTIEGHSAAANKLIALMAAEASLKNPSFGAPVVRGENRLDVFTIQAGLGP